MTVLVAFVFAFVRANNEREAITEKIDENITKCHGDDDASRALMVPFEEGFGNIGSEVGSAASEDVGPASFLLLGIAP